MAKETLQKTFGRTDPSSFYSTSEGVQMSTVALSKLIMLGV